jgi:DNA-directed RNA polymerase subunit RPC12/RpoP
LPGRMPKCPECGSRIWFFTDTSGERVCSHCNAIVRHRMGPDGTFLGDLEVVGHSSKADALPNWAIRDLPSVIQNDLASGLPEPGLPVTKEDRSEEKTPPPSPRQSERSEVIWKPSSSDRSKLMLGHCNHCSEVVVISNARYCSSCGASLVKGVKDKTTLDSKDQSEPTDHVVCADVAGEKCMVCSLKLSDADNVVWCPYCGSPAHREHLFEWIHRRGRCPVCGVHLENKDF